MMTQLGSSRRNRILQLLESYTVKQQEKYFKLKWIKSWVPQGSILGPL